MNQFFNTDLLHYGSVHIRVFDIFEVIAIFLFIWLFLKLFLTPIFKRIFRRKQVDEGRQYAFLQFTKYILYTLAVLLAVQSIGVNISLILAGSAALFVGIGFGLQQTFNDLVSGIILLLEGSVEVGDVVYLDGIVGRVFKIGLRTSKVEDRDKNVIIVPNSKLITEKVYNWSYNAHPTRFHIDVGVSYGSDVRKVETILLEAIRNVTGVRTEPAPAVHFIGFGNSSLDFKLFFFSTDLMGIEKIKSVIRFNILSLFRQHQIEIPFPQHDLWFKNILDFSEIPSGGHPAVD